jgi:hypothetical protein
MSSAHEVHHESDAQFSLKEQYTFELMDTLAKARYTDIYDEKRHICIANQTLI